MSNKKYFPLGKVLHIVENKEAIVRLNSKKIPKKGILVVNEEMKIIGKTTDPFGPVKAPYVGIILDTPSRAPTPGEVVLGVETAHQRSKSRGFRSSSKKKPRDRGRRKPNKK